MREAAEAELREILLDEPDWKDVLRVVPIEPRPAGCVGELNATSTVANRIRLGKRQELAPQSNSVA
ncbi:MAG TPA: hypothetical protein VK613_04465 [Gaiellaceae bacterium]|nr:hypothetical protein [Gaiellaceae bacterium]